MNTHMAGDNHFHSDTCYAFEAQGAASAEVEDGESTDLRWMSLADLRRAAQTGEALADVADIYGYLLQNEPELLRLPATGFETADPVTGLTYVRQEIKPSEK